MKRTCVCVGVQEGGFQLMFHITDTMIPWGEHTSFYGVPTEVVQILTADFYQMQMAYGTMVAVGQSNRC